MKYSRNTVLILLLYLYLFLAPFEDLLEYLYGIETMLKPYRVVGIVILLIGFFANLRKGFFVFKADKILLLFFGYGVAYTLILLFWGARVNMSQFLNTVIQMTFLILIYLTVKRLDINYRQFHWMMACMTAGLLINGGIIVADFYVFSLSTREKGLTDNANAAAFNMSIAIIYLVYWLRHGNFRLIGLRSILIWGMIIFFILALLATGSRSGLLILIVCSFLYTIVFTSWVSRIKIILTTTVITAFLLLTTDIVKQAGTSVTTFNRLTMVDEDIRVVLWEAGLHAIPGTRFMGMGIAQMHDPKNLKKYLAMVNPSLAAMLDKRDKGLAMHNLYLDLAVEVGLIGLAMFLLFVWYVVKFQFNLLRTSKYRDVHQLTFVMLLGLLMLGMTAKGLLSSIFWYIVMINSMFFTDPDQS